MLGNRPNTPSPRLLRVDRSARPGWKTGLEQEPRPGQQVYCTEGMAVVVRIAGKTGDGSRLLELQLLEKEAPPFYAAASNVLVAPISDGAAAGNGSSAAVEGAGSSPAPEAIDFAAADAAGDDDSAPAAPAPDLNPDAPSAPQPPALEPDPFASLSWALDGSALPGSAPLPGSLPGHIEPAGPLPGSLPHDEAAPAADDAQRGTVAVDADEPEGSAADTGAARNGKEDVVDSEDDPGDAPVPPPPPTIPLDPSVFWIR